MYSSGLYSLRVPCRRPLNLEKFGIRSTGALLLLALFAVIFTLWTSKDRTVLVLIIVPVIIVTVVMAVSFVRDRRKASSEPHIAAHAFTSHNRTSLMQSDRCGCFHCLAEFSTDEIIEWIDDGDTALCPKCGIDAVIGSGSGYPISPEFLGDMQKHWFYSQ